MTRNLKPLFTWRGAICSAESQLPPSSRHVALTLSLHMSERGSNCFPTLGTLASETGLSERAVQYHLKILEDTGWLSVTRPKRQGRGMRNEYVAVVPRSTQQLHLYPWEKGATDDTEGCKEPREKGATDDTIPDRPSFTEDVHLGRTTGATGTPSAAAPETAQDLVSFYADECKRHGYTPTAQWKRTLGNQAKRLLAEKPIDKIRSAITRIALEHKQPGVLAAVLTDVEAGTNGHHPRQSSNIAAAQEAARRMRGTG